MPRISKRKKTQPKERTDSKKKSFRAGIYARLSSDQDVQGKTDKNESIEVQIDIAKKHITQLTANGENIELIEIYRDLGKTGSNFNRDEFSRMMEDVRLSEINCIIVKDLSRFGRNYLEAGNYIEKIFPFLGVRFIAVSDCFDTFMESVNNKKMAMNIKNLVNDMYAKDFSKKAKIHLQQSREQGSYVGGPTPYGYTHIWEGSIKKLTPDPDAKPIVEWIYERFIQVQNYAAVTKELNKHRINPPGIYQKMKEVVCREEQEYHGWGTGSVERILKSETYIGVLLQGKSSITARDESSRIRYDRDKWIVVENSHEPLITREIFDQAQDIAKKIRQRTMANNRKADSIPLPENIFNHVLTCGLCGRKMIRKSSVKTYQNGDVKRLESYECPNTYNNKSGRACESNRISKEMLMHILLSSLRLEFALYLERPGYFLDYLKKIWTDKKTALEAGIRKIEGQIERLEDEESNLYMQYRLQGGSSKIYLDIKSKNHTKIENLQSDISKKRAELKTLDQTSGKQCQAIKGLLKLNKQKDMSQEFVDSLIERISIYPGKQVEIIYSFTGQDEFSKSFREGCI